MMDKKTLLDLKDGLRNARSGVENELVARGVRDDLNDTPVFDRSKRKHKSLRQEMLDEIRSWSND